MIQALKKQFLYNHLANSRLIEIIETVESPPEKVMKLISHVLTSHQTWLNRISPESAPEKPYGIWEVLPVQELESLNKENMQRSIAILENSKEDEILKTDISYRNSLGEPFTTKAEDILNHLLLHCAYHRGQIAMNLRENGITPAPTDYILYVRGTL